MSAVAPRGSLMSPSAWAMAAFIREVAPSAVFTSSAAASGSTLEGSLQLAQRASDDRARLGTLLRGQPGIEHRGEPLVEALARAKRLQHADLLAGPLRGVQLVLPVPGAARVLAATDGEEAPRARQCDRSCGASHPSPPGVMSLRKSPRGFTPTARLLPIQRNGRETGGMAQAATEGRVRPDPGGHRSRAGRAEGPLERGPAGRGARREHRRRCHLADERRHRPGAGGHQGPARRHRAHLAAPQPRRLRPPGRHRRAGGAAGPGRGAHPGGAGAGRQEPAGGEPARHRGPRGDAATRARSPRCSRRCSSSAGTPCSRRRRATRSSRSASRPRTR